MKALVALIAIAATITGALGFVRGNADLYRASFDLVLVMIVARQAISIHALEKKSK